MKLQSSFTVPSAPDKVLALFLDASTMQICIPGCEHLAQVNETSYEGTLVNEVAHVRFTARFSAEITSTTAPASTEEAGVVTAILKGEDRRLGSTIKINAKLTVAPRPGSGDSSDVHYEFELAMWGKLGRLGESVIRRRSMEVERQFVEALTAVCSGQPVPQASVRSLRKGRTASSALGPDRGLDQGVAVPSGTERPARGLDDRAVLGLVAAAAFAYGVLFGRRTRSRR